MCLLSTSIKDKFHCIAVCLLVWSFSSHSRIFHSYTSPLPMKGCKFFTCARHSWPLSSEDSLTSHTICDTGLPFIMVIPEDPRHPHLLPSLWQWSCHYLFLRLRSVAAGIRTPNLPLARGKLYPTASLPRLINV